MEEKREKDQTPKYTCREYREEMTLIGLRKMLEKKDLSPEERKEIEKQIEQLEEKMGLL
ncbi:hypothetical protein JCM13304A_10510 [Desulfothermus okinawensis JCM 13304]